MKADKAVGDADHSKTDEPGSCHPRHDSQPMRHFLMGVRQIPGLLHGKAVDRHGWNAASQTEKHSGSQYRKQGHCLWPSVVPVAGLHGQRNTCRLAHKRDLQPPFHVLVEVRSLFRGLGRRG